MTTQLEGPAATRALPAPEAEVEKSSSLRSQSIKIVLLGLVVAIAVWAAFPLAGGEHWIGLGILAATTAGLLYLYLSPRHIPAKYLVPGTIFLIIFQIFPVLYTAGTAFTNFGDGHRGNKAEAITAIQTASVTRVPGSTEYQLKILAKGDQLAFLITDPKTGKVSLGDAGGLKPVDGVPAGYTVLNAGEASARSREITDFAVPTAAGAIRSAGLSRAYEGKAVRAFDPATDSIRDTTTGKVWKADDGQGAFVATDGERLAQGWKVNVGFANFTRVLTDDTIRSSFVGTLIWDFLFAIGSTGGTFLLGMFCAIALQSTRMRFRGLYRILMVLPYAMPSFAMLLVWRDMFNTDFGLINNVLGIHVDWLGTPITAQLAVLLVQLWLGYPYMFLVTTGALQAIPAELTDATKVDGAGPFQAFRAIKLPLLLVALTPLLISSFAFNFNNFNAIYLTTEGGPFPADNPNSGATDLLITYTYRLAFGGSGAQYGFAAAISIFIFLIVAVVSAVSFRRTRAQEEVYS
ncbi:multiple sugar transporter permease [Actinoplanes sp. SE50]|uniref:ABC transporter permease subunit n=1 Tax=unclassified Actinoplanes TaxID=2626549 RepID=UPI00023ED2EF|nr:MULTISPECIES: ABC transporter permease subunit [unclassified Actinoplanes]AEV87283.1 maltose/maltodextrin transport system permease protein [Actinoplanes sp. SE50/110]ATO85683.1 multiple sugar transporter permease [Actinoplanes sp. SE50]SLM03096.1 ABC-type maltose/maltodextrin transporter, permease component [Actinoplanes sp. SE50/110]